MAHLQLQVEDSTREAYRKPCVRLTQKYTVTILGCDDYVRAA